MISSGYHLHPVSAGEQLDPLALPVAVVTPPAAEPVTVAQIKDHCRIDIADEDTYLGTLLAAARPMLEERTNRAFILQTLRVSFDRAPVLSEFRLPRAPLVSVSGITYVDTNGATQTLATSVYGVDAAAEPGRVYLKVNQSWPDVQCGPGAMVVTYTAGAATADACDARIKHALKFLCAHWYFRREPLAESGAAPGALSHALEALVAQLRVY